MTRATRGEDHNQWDLGPTAVAFDSTRNLAIANAGNNTIVEYTPTGIQSVVIPNQVLSPVAIAFDALDDL